MRISTCDFFSFKPPMFIQLYFLVVINASCVYKYSQCRKKIMGMAKFICYFSYISLIYFNILRLQTHSCFIVYKIQRAIIIQKNISYTRHLHNLYIKYVNNKLLFLALLSSILAICITSYVIIIFIWYILYLKIYDLYFLLSICLYKAVMKYFYTTLFYTILQFITLL